MVLKDVVFDPVVARIQGKADSLKEIKRFPKTGIEGWLKVEVVAALGKNIIKLKNRGPDLILENDLRIELKAATDLNVAGIIQGGALKYKCPCLFLGDGNDPRKIEAFGKDPRITLIDHVVVSDGENKWVLGIIEPKI